MSKPNYGDKLEALLSSGKIKLPKVYSVPKIEELIRALNLFSRSQVSDSVMDMRLYLHQNVGDVLLLEEITDGIYFISIKMGDHVGSNLVKHSSEVDILKAAMDAKRDIAIGSLIAEHLRDKLKKKNNGEETPQMKPDYSQIINKMIEEGKITLPSCHSESLCLLTNVHNAPTSVIDANFITDLWISEIALFQKLDDVPVYLFLGIPKSGPGKIIFLLNEGKTANILNKAIANKWNVTIGEAINSPEKENPTMKKVIQTGTKILPDTSSSLTFMDLVVELSDKTLEQYVGPFKANGVMFFDSDTGCLTGRECIDFDLHAWNEFVAAVKSNGSSVPLLNTLLMYVDPSRHADILEQIEEKRNKNPETIITDLREKVAILEKENSDLLKGRNARDQAINLLEQRVRILTSEVNAFRGANNRPFVGRFSDLPDTPFSNCPDCGRPGHCVKCTGMSNGTHGQNNACVICGGPNPQMLGLCNNCCSQR